MLDVARNGCVARVALDRPQQRNALSEDLIAALRQELVALGRDPAIRAVVLSGNGPSFCAGADAAWLDALTRQDEAMWNRSTRALAALLVEMTTFEKPLVARLHGHVVGAGVALAATCDHAICADATRFALPELRLGMPPSIVTPFLIARLGPAIAKSLLLAEPEFGARRAAEIGLVQFVGDAQALDAAEAAVLDTIMMSPPGAIAEFKRLHLALTMPDLVRQVELAVACAGQTLESREARLGIEAMRGKAPPPWRNDRRSAVAAVQGKVVS